MVLAEHFGSEGPYTDGDLDKDGIVQFSDFVLLADNFGKTVETAATVPEPSAAILFVLGFTAFVALRRAPRTWCTVIAR